MKNKLLILKVRDAKLFRPGKRDNHGMVTAAEVGPVKRAETPDAWVECPHDTFLASSISGALHVLAGERPVPTIRKNLLPGAPQRVVVLDELAKGSFVEVTSGVAVDKETGELQYLPKFGEVLMTRKSWTESTDPAAYPLSVIVPKGRALAVLSWDRCYAHLGDDMFVKLCGHIASVLHTSLESVKGMSLHGALGAAHMKQDPTTFTFIEENSLKEPWKSLLVEGETTDKAKAKALRMGYDKYLKESYALAVPRGKEMVSVRDAIVYVPVEESDLPMFQRGPGWATILDGGLVSIEGVSDYFPAVLSSAKPTSNPEGLSCI